MSLNLSQSADSVFGSFSLTFSLKHASALFRYQLPYFSMKHAAAVSQSDFRHEVTLRRRAFPGHSFQNQISCPLSVYEISKEICFLLAS